MDRQYQQIDPLCAVIHANNETLNWKQTYRETVLIHELE